jgi:hypothetical protein
VRRARAARMVHLVQQLGVKAAVPGLAATTLMVLVQAFVWSSFGNVTDHCSHSVQSVGVSEGRHLQRVEPCPRSARVHVHALEQWRSEELHSHLPHGTPQHDGCPVHMVGQCVASCTCWSRNTWRALLAQVERDPLQLPSTLARYGFRVLPGEAGGAARGELPGSSSGGGGGGGGGRGAGAWGTVVDAMCLHGVSSGQGSVELRAAAVPLGSTSVLPRVCRTQHRGPESQPPAAPGGIGGLPQPPAATRRRLAILAWLSARPSPHS